MIKCQKCPKPATIHITEIVQGSPLEFHLCEEHARQQLSSEESAEPAADPGPDGPGEGDGRRQRREREEGADEQGQDGPQLILRSCFDGP